MAAFPWVRIFLSVAFVLAGLVLARRTIVTCSKDTGVCRYGEQRLVGGDVHEVRIDEVERVVLDRIMNREGERRSQAIFLMKSGARVPATAMDERDKSDLVTRFAALQSGERTAFVDSNAGLAAYAAVALGAIGLVLLGFALRRPTSSK